jgi:hypothetical protein
MPQFNPLQMLGRQQARPRVPASSNAADLLASSLMESNVDSPNSPVTLSRNLGQLGDEADLRAIMAERAGDAPNEISALKQLAGRWHDQRADTIQNMQPSPFQQEQTSAINEGFGNSDLNPNPVIARNLYKRNFEQEKMRQPIQEQAMKQAGDTQRQNIASGAQRYVADRGYEEGVDVETIRQEPQNKYAETQRMLLLDEAGQPRAGGNIASVGKGAVRYQSSPNPTTANNQLAIIRGNLVKQGGVPFINRNNPTREQTEYNSYLMSTIAGSNLDPEAKQDIAALFERPESAEMSIEQLIQSLPIDHSQLDDALLADITDLFMKLKG